MLPKITQGAPDPLQRPWLEGARDLVRLEAPESLQDSFSLTRVYQNNPAGRRELVACSVDGLELPRDPGNQAPVTPRPRAEDHQIVVQQITAQAPSARAQTLADGWFIAGQTTTVVEDDRVALRVEDRATPQGYQESVTLLERPPEFESRISAWFPAETQLSQDELDRAARETPETIRAREAGMTDRVSLLRERYGSLREASILELGPFTTTVVPNTLVQPDNGNRYLGIDVNPIALEKQREALDEARAPRCRQLEGDFHRHIDCPDASVDLIVAYSSFGLGHPAPQAIEALGEARRVLKPGGEFLIEGWDLANSAPQTVAYVLDQFEVVGASAPGRGVILRRPA